MNAKLGDASSISPTYQGGGLINCKEFLLPEIENGVISEELKRLRSN